MVGPISNLNLTIGGLDIAISHPNNDSLYNYFDPASLLLNYGAVDPTFLESIVVFGNPFGAGIPSNYAVADENSTNGYLDPYYGLAQNRVETYDINPVPEPSTMLLIGTGLAGLAIGGRKKKTGMV